MNNEEHPPHPFSEQERLQVLTPKPTHSRCVRLTAGVLGLLAVVLFIADVSLGVHYNKLTDAHLTLDDTESIGTELTKLQDMYKTVFKVMTDAQRQVDAERKRQTQTDWELEHEKKRTTECERKTQEMPQEITSLKDHLLFLSDGCKHCPEGWVFMNSMCYYFSSFKFSPRQQGLTWSKARGYCQQHRGDLVIIDSREKENSIVSHLRGKLVGGLKELLNNPRSTFSFWIGLRRTGANNDGTWKWVNQTVLDEGYWSMGEPRVTFSEQCVVLYPNENFFQAWIDRRCNDEYNWICEKTPIISR
ncbi:C-type lectin domain family 4 member M-like isoform X2 [Sphaeramia orbicularis]|nr:C-type lectin domain family 4 member M-like isoform X2 [Sphaeramia orbicularis]